MAVREVEHGEWFDVDTVTVLRETTEEEVRATDKRIPSWAATHPVLRIAEAELLEGEPSLRLAALADIVNILWPADDPDYSWGGDTFDMIAQRLEFLRPKTEGGPL